MNEMDTWTEVKNFFFKNNNFFSFTFFHTLTEKNNVPSYLKVKANM